MQIIHVLLHRLIDRGMIWNEHLVLNSFIVVALLKGGQAVDCISGAIKSRTL